MNFRTLRNTTGGALCLICTVLATTIAMRVEAARVNWRARLARDLVQVNDGSFSLTEHGVISFPGTSAPNLRVRLRAEAPADGTISRDMFVSATSGIQAAFFCRMEAEAPTPDQLPVAGPPPNSFKYTEVDSPEGVPDLDIRLRFDEAGVHVAFTNSKSGGSSEETRTWDQVFE